MSKIANNEIQANSLSDNKIQAKTPEIGDIVKAQTGDIFTVIAVSQNAVRVMKKYPFIKMKTFSKPNYDVVFTYVGKAKATISDLFKTENE